MDRGGFLGLGLAGASSGVVTMSGARQRVVQDMRAQLGLRSPAYVRFFSSVFRRTLRQGFNSIRLANRPPPSVLQAPALVIYSNHCSWWDGALFLFVAESLLKGRAVYTPMDAEMVQRYGFFQRIGAFGIEKNRPVGVVRFLEGCRLVLSNPQNVLLMTAQGRFADVRQRPISLDAGIAHIAHVAPAALYIPLAVECAFWVDKRPELLLRFGAPLHAGDLLGPNAANLHMLERSLTVAMDELAADAIARDAGAFEVLMSGGGGINPVYDVWRRLRALAQGRRYHAQHGPEL